MLAWANLLEGDEAVGALPLDFVRVGHHRRFSHLGVLHEGWLDLGGAQQVPRDVDHVINPTRHPDVAVTVLFTTWKPSNVLI